MISRKLLVLLLGTLLLSHAVSAKRGGSEGTEVEPTETEVHNSTLDDSTAVQDSTLDDSKPTGITCANVRCMAGTECVMEKGRPKCRKIRVNPCAAMLCMTGTVCEVKGNKGRCVSICQTAEWTKKCKAPKVCTTDKKGRPKCGKAARRLA